MPVVRNNSAYLGIDPGASGGIALLSITEEVLHCCKMPETERDVWDLLSGFQRDYKTVAVIEKVQGYIGKDQPGSAMFKFGMSYGGLRMCLIGAHIPFQEVTPQGWLKELLIPLRKKGSSKTEWKNTLKAKAQQLFPEENVTLATADALLIAAYCRKVN